MKTINLGGVLPASEIALGCMRHCRVPFEDAERLVLEAVDLGVTMFDHADVYGNGASEEVFGKILERNPGMREKVLVQSKFGLIRDTESTLGINTSKEYIIKSAEDSLKRLKTDHMDTFLIHRADTLMDPEEVCEAFDQLHREGKVRYFGVANFKAMDLAFLEQNLNQHLIINQLQLSAAHTTLIDATDSIHQKESIFVDRTGNVLTWMRMNKMNIQAWSPFQAGFYGGVFLFDENYPKLNAIVSKIAEAHGVSTSAIAIAWILRHPAKIQPLLGTTNRNRLKDICTASDVQMTREEWYEIYRACIQDEDRFQYGNSNSQKSTTA